MNSGECKECGNVYEFKARTIGICRPCQSRACKLAKYPDRKRIAPRSVDHLPKVDPIMELQFKRFFDLVRVRYTCQKDVSQTIDMNSHKKPYKRKV